MDTDVSEEHVAFISNPEVRSSDTTVSTYKTTQYVKPEKEKLKDYLLTPLHEDGKML
jgi:hypothetical protein